MYRKPVNASQVQNASSSGVGGPGASGVGYTSGASGISGLSGSYSFEICTVDKLNINEVVDLFTQGNLTVKEMDKWICAHGIKNASKSKDNGVVRYQFTYGNRDFNISCSGEAAKSQTDNLTQKTYLKNALKDFDQDTINKYFVLAEKYGNYVEKYALRPDCEFNDVVELKKALKEEADKKTVIPSITNIPNLTEIKNNPVIAKNYIKEMYTSLFENGILDDSFCETAVQNSFMFVEQNKDRTNLDELSLFKNCLKAQVHINVTAKNLNIDFQELIDFQLAFHMDAICHNGDSDSVSTEARSRTLSNSKNTKSVSDDIPDNIKKQIYDTLGNSVSISIDAEYNVKNEIAYEIKDKNNNHLGLLFVDANSYTLNMDGSVVRTSIEFNSTGQELNRSYKFKLSGEAFINAIKDGTLTLDKLDAYGNNVFFCALGNNTSVQEKIDAGDTSFYELCDVLRNSNNELKDALNKHFDSLGYSDLKELLNNTVEDSTERLLSIAYFGYSRLLKNNSNNGFVWSPNGVLYDETGKQGSVGSCWFLAANIAASVHQEYIQTIKDEIVSIDNDKNTYTIKVRGNEYTYTSEQLGKAVELSGGDPDIRPFEMAAREYFNSLGAKNPIAHGGLLSQFTEFLTGEDLSNTYYTSTSSDEIISHIKSGKYIATIYSMDKGMKVIDSETGQELNFINQHAYAVIGADNDYVYIKNPWDSSKLLKLDINTFKNNDFCYQDVKTSDLVDHIKIGNYNTIHTKHFEFKPDKLVDKFEGDKIMYKDGSYDILNDNEFTRYDENGIIYKSIVYDTDNSHIEYNTGTSFATKSFINANNKLVRREEYTNNNLTDVYENTDNGCIATHYTDSKNYIKRFYDKQGNEYKIETCTNGVITTKDVTSSSSSEQHKPSTPAETPDDQIFEDNQTYIDFDNGQNVSTPERYNPATPDYTPAPGSYTIPGDTTVPESEPNPGDSAQPDGQQTNPTTQGSGSSGNNSATGSEYHYDLTDSYPWKNPYKPENDKSIAPPTNDDVNRIVADYIKNKQDEIAQKYPESTSQLSVEANYDPVTGKINISCHVDISGYSPGAGSTGGYTGPSVMDLMNDVQKRIEGALANPNYQLSSTGGAGGDDGGLGALLAIQEDLQAGKYVDENGIFDLVAYYSDLALAGAINNMKVSQFKNDDGNSYVVISFYNTDGTKVTKSFAIQSPQRQQKLSTADVEMFLKEIAREISLSGSGLSASEYTIKNSMQNIADKITQEAIKKYSLEYIDKYLDKGMDMLSAIHDLTGSNSQVGGIDEDTYFMLGDMDVSTYIFKKEEEDLNSGLYNNFQILLRSVDRLAYLNRIQMKEFDINDLETVYDNLINETYLNSYAWAATDFGLPSEEGRYLGVYDTSGPSTTRGGNYTGYAYVTKTVSQQEALKTELTNSLYDANRGLASTGYTIAPDVMTDERGYGYLVINNNNTGKSIRYYLDSRSGQYNDFLTEQGQGMSEFKHYVDMLNYKNNIETNIQTAQLNVYQKSALVALGKIEADELQNAINEYNDLVNNYSSTNNAKNTYYVYNDGSIHTSQYDKYYIRDGVSEGGDTNPFGIG